MRIRPNLAAAALAVLAVSLTAAAPAVAADVPVVADPAATQITALDGTLAWVTGRAGAEQTLMLRDAAGVRRVPGAPAARFYRSIDLGRDRSDRLVLTYERCNRLSRCVARRDDLRGHRASVARPGPSGCTPTTAPALWRSRAAYGLACVRGRIADPRRSGLYVRTGTRPARRVPPPADAVRFGISDVTSVDLRGTTAAAVLADVYAYAFASEPDGRNGRSVLAAASEGDSDERAAGLALGAGGVLWSLTDAEHAGDPLQAVVNALDGDCRRTEILTSAAGSETFPATDVAADAGTLYLLVPGTGVVEHDFDPSGPAC